MILYISEPKLIYILHFDARRNVIHNKRRKNYPYLSPWAKNEENKGTIFSKTFKVEKSKYLIFVNFGSRDEI